jgi:hypothetical protein
VAPRRTRGRNRPGNVYGVAQVSLSGITAVVFTLRDDELGAPRKKCPFDASFPLFTLTTIHSQEIAAMNDSKVLPTVTEIIDGPVTSIDRVYAFDRLRDVCRAAPHAVRRARTRLTSPPQPPQDCQAAAEGTLLLDGDLIVCAGVTATTMREAIDLLMAQLRYRLRRLAETKRDQPIGSLPVSAA